MVNTRDWVKENFLQFENQIFQNINLTNCKALSNLDNYDFNTELNFINCKIESFNAATLVIGKKITFVNCAIGFLQCYASCFCGGFSLTNSLIGGAQFDCGGHNKNPYDFIISNCQFDNFVGFFDIYFEGPVKITENDFKGGTNILTYLGVPYGIKEGIPFSLIKNKGKLDTLENS